MSDAPAQVAVALTEVQAMDADPHPVARDFQARGGRMCGVVGSDVPEELILAAGFQPIRLRGDATITPEQGDRYGHLAEPVTRSILARLVDGTYDYLEALVVDRSIDAHATLFFNLRQIRLMLPEVRLPKLHFFDLLHLPHLTTARYNRDRVRELAAWLVDLAGRPMDTSTITAEIARGNALRATLAELGALRTARPPRIPGSDALALIGCAMLVPRQEYSRRLLSALREAVDAPPIHGRRLFVTGSSHDSDSLYRAIEREGWVVVGEDHDWGDRYYADPIDVHVAWLDALTDRAMFGAPAAAKYGLAERVRYICERVDATGAESVLSLNRDGDDAAAWEYPDLAAALHKNGVSSARIDGLPYDGTAAARVIEALGGLR